MKATFKDYYKKKSDKTGEILTVFRYLLDGKPEDLKKYKSLLEADGIPVHTDETTKTMIFFETVYHGNTCDVVITETGKIVVPDNKLEFLQSQMRLASDPSVKSALAQAIANYMLEKIMGGSAPSVTAEIPVSPEDTDLGAGK